MIKDALPVTRSRESELISQLNNRYFAARYLEISSLIHALSDKGILKQHNLDENVTELGAGSGIGLLALRKYSEGTLGGVDIAKNFFEDINHYCGKYDIPTPELLQAAEATFHPGDNSAYLQNLQNHSLSLLAWFYIDSESLQQIPQIMNEASRVLKSGGQLVMTTDWTIREIPESSQWEDPIVWQGDEGKRRLTLILPFSDELRLNYGDMIEFAGNLLEHEIHASKARTIGCIRDRFIMVCTKK